MEQVAYAKQRLVWRPVHLLLPIFGFIEFDSSVGVLVTKLQHPVDEAGEHVRHGSDGFGGPEFGTRPAGVLVWSAFATFTCNP